MQTKSYISDIASAMKKDKIMKPFADKFKKDAMKTMNPKKSLEDVLQIMLLERILQSC